MAELTKKPSNETEIPKDQTLGDILENARKKKHLDIEDISTTLCIKPIYIEALEKGHYYVFPARAYTVGFLRTYAQFLKLDTDEILQLFYQETTDTKEEPMDMLVIEKKMALPSKKTLAVVIGIFIAFYVIWYLIAKSYSPQSLIEESLPTIESEPIAVVQEEQIPVEEKIEEVIPVKAENTQKVIEEVSVDVYTAPVAFVAIDRVWVSIKDNKNNKVLLDKTFIKNEHYIPNVPVENLTVSTGRGGVLDLYIDGTRNKTFKKEDNTPLIGLTKD
jgi:cytoskeletal protein RodZ